MKILLLFTLLSTNAFAQDIHNLRAKSLTGFIPTEFTGQDVKIGVIDSGIVNGLPGRVYSRPTDTVDREGHGTGAASAVWILAPGAEVISTKVVENGVGSRKAVIEGILYAIQKGAQIINLSLSFDEVSYQEVKRSLSEESFAEVLFVTAAGNDGCEIREPLGENVLIIGALDLNLPLARTSYSCFGMGVELYAPAGAARDGLTVHDLFGGYRLFNGTSAAAPLVSGALALYKEKFPHSSGAELKKLILADSREMNRLKVLSFRSSHLGDSSGPLAPETLNLGRRISHIPYP